MTPITDLDSELALLAIEFDFPEYIPDIIQIITADVFYDITHQLIFSTFLQHHTESLPFSLPALARTLKKNPVAIQVLAGLVDTAGTGTNFRYYVNNIIEAANYRRLQEIGTHLMANPANAAEIMGEIAELCEGTPTRHMPLFKPVPDLLSVPIQISYTIDKLIEADTTGQLFGPSGGGKTFVALCMALAIATGRQWNGRKVQPGIVLYLAGEGRHGLVRRIRAWLTRNPSADLSNFHISTQTIEIDGNGATAVIREGKALAERLCAPVGLVVVDTLARHLPGDENSTRDMGGFVGALDRVRDAFPGSVALIIHHTGNGEDTKTRSRGSSALKAAMDFEIRCDKGLLTSTKMKDSEASAPIEFKLVPVQIGTNDDGESITSCVVEYGQRSMRILEPELTPHERILSELTREHTAISELRIAFYDKRLESEPDTSQDTLRKSFSRALDGLKLKELLVTDGDNVKSGHRTKHGHGVTLSGQVDRTDTDTTLKGCPAVRPVSAHGFEVVRRSRFQSQGF